MMWNVMIFCMVYNVSFEWKSNQDPDTITLSMLAYSCKLHYDVWSFQSVWGSYWRDGRWGFQCCHSFIKESYCTGEAGKEAHQESAMILAPVAATFQNNDSSDESDHKKVINPFNLNCLDKTYGTVICQLCKHYLC